MQELVSDPDLIPVFERADTCVRYQLHDPDSAITVDSRHGEPPHVDLGASASEPEVVISMDADVAHDYLLGNLDMTVALAPGQVGTPPRPAPRSRGEMVAEGPVNKILAVLPIFEPLLPRYRALVPPPNGGG